MKDQDQIVMSKICQNLPLFFLMQPHAAPLTNNPDFHSSITLGSKTFTYQTACSSILSFVSCFNHCLEQSVRLHPPMPQWPHSTPHPKSPGHLEAPETTSRTGLPHPPHLDPTVHRKHPELCHNQDEPTHRSVSN